MSLFTGSVGCCGVLKRVSLLLALTASGIGTAMAEPAYELVILNGRIVDGSGAPWYRGDLGIRQGKIVKIGRLDAADGRKAIDAEGLIVAPGFIDMMGQTATPMMENPQTAINLLTQGITTINAGEGVSAAPLSESDGNRLGWRTMSEYFTLLELQGLPINVVQSVGHTQVRRIVLGDAERRPTPEELAQMQALVEEAMQAGAIGVSTALIYPPAVFADTDEIAALVAVAGKHGGRYYTHMRNEGDQLLEAIEEALEIGREGNAPVHIFHLKTAGRQNWGKMPLAIARIKAARAAGQQVTADIYPYINNGLGIAALVHPRHFARGERDFLMRLDDAAFRAEIRKEMETTGGWENWYRHVGQDWGKIIIGQTNDARYAGLAGQSVAQLAAAKNEEPWETFFHLVRAGAFALPESMTDANKILAMQQEFMSFCTDVGPASGSRIASHPRAFGAFPRLFARYVRELGILSLEQAVARASAVAANDVLAYDRGRIAEGLAADVIVFDELEFTDTATFSNPSSIARGMKFVVVNGVVVLEEGQYSGAKPGRVLRGPGYRTATSPAAVSNGSSETCVSEFDSLMSQFLAEHRIPGAALAVTYRGRLVHAKGYGYADIAAGEPATPNSLFRIASISKPITAVAILRLVDEGKLSLDDRIFELLDFEKHTEEFPNYDPRLKEITIRHLLEHRGGWDRDVSFDAMFQAVRFAQKLDVPPPAGTVDVIRAMFDQKLDFAPGERYAYSNYGYCLLGRAIEKVTGKPYEEYVREEILAPLGIREMRIGRTFLEDRSPGEVRYYFPGRGTSVFARNLGAEIPSVYGAWHHEAMDSHGAWIASAVDLARFACAFDDPEACPVLKPQSIAAMHARPDGLAGYDAEGKPKPTYYSLGWSNKTDAQGRDVHAHSGSLPGTATTLIRRDDGLNAVILFNARSSPTVSHFGRGIEVRLLEAIDRIAVWPEGDLFE